MADRKRRRVTTAIDVEAAAKGLGFLAAGVATLDPNEHGAVLDRWLASGHAGTMRYLHRQAAKRKAPAKIVPGATRAVMVLDNYFQPDPPGAGVRIAKYARGRDYHVELLDRLRQLGAWLTERGATIVRPYADDGPVPERELAARAGLGWIGKNTMLIRPGTGSFFFIGAILTDLVIEPTPPLETDHCGTCTRCIEACPTEAILETRVLDASRCISFLTIEYKKEPPPELAARYQGFAFGCDICNDVCPWNERFAAPTSVAAYQDRTAVPRQDPGYFARMTETEFADRFGDTPLERPGLAGMRRNFTHAFASLDS